MAETKSIWNVYEVTFRFLTKLCAQTPANPDIIRRWLETRAPEVKAPGAKSLEVIQEEVLEAIERGEGEPSQEFSKLVFCHDEDGSLAYRHDTIRAHVKDCARVLSAQFWPRQKGERAFSTRVINGVYTDETKYWIPILDFETMKPRRSPDGTLEKPVHARGMRGEPINALKAFDYVDGAAMKFQLKVLGNSVHEDDLAIVFQYGGTHGYAGERSAGEGRYVHQMKKISEAWRPARAEESPAEIPKKTRKEKAS